MEVQAKCLGEGALLPLVIESIPSFRPTLDDLKAWLLERHDWLEDALIRHGGLLFRGFPVRDVRDFASLLHTLSPELVRYVGGQSERSIVAGNIYTSTELPASLQIPLHNEMSYLLEPPRLIYFFCQTPAARGGQTPIADCRRVYQRLAEAHPDLCDKFESKGVMYLKNMHSENKAGATFGISWQAHYETDDKQAVEDFLRSESAEFEWGPDESLSIRSVLPAVRSNPKTGETVWFNQAHLWHPTNLEANIRRALTLYCGEEGLPTNARFGDGSPIGDEELECVRDALLREAVIYSWQEGDLLMLDNFSAAHGRKSFDGERKILVAMA